MARQRYQKGSVYLRGKEPKWIGRWREDVMNAAGETRRVKRSEVLGTKAELPTMKLAQRRLDLILARINAPAYRPGRMSTLAEFAERWEELVLVQHKPSSQRVAKIHLRRFILPRLGTLRLDQLGREVQQGFVAWLGRKQSLAQMNADMAEGQKQEQKQGPGNNPKTRDAQLASLSRKYVLNVMGTLGSMLRTAAAWGYIAEAVSMRMLALPQAEVRRPARFFSAEQARRIVASASGMERVLYQTALLTGMRSGELLGLQREDLDFERRMIHIRRSVWERRVQTPKSKASAMPIPMPDALAVLLREYLAEQKTNAEGWVFANRWGRPVHAAHFVQRRLHPVLDALGIPRCGLHAFRHTHCSLLVDSGAPAKVVQEQMRHTDVRTTLGIYAHAAVGAQRMAVEKVAAMLAPNGPKEERVEQWIH